MNLRYCFSQDRREKIESTKAKFEMKLAKEEVDRPAEPELYEPIFDVFEWDHDWDWSSS